MTKKLATDVKRKAVIGIYSTYGCMSAEQASCFIKRKMDLTISASAVSGIMRALFAKGYAGSSKNEKNTTIYWLTVPAWEIKEEENDGK